MASTRSSSALLGGPVIALALALPGAGCREEPEEPAPEVPAEVEWCEAVADWDPEWSAFELEIVAEINARRSAGAICGKDELYEATGELELDPALRCAARRHSLDMAEQDYFDHTSPDGVSVWDRVELAGYTGEPLSQNITANQPSAEIVVEGWMGSTGQCRNVMDPEAEQVGVGYVLATDAEFEQTWTVVFGRPAGADTGTDTGS